MTKRIIVNVIPEEIRMALADDTRLLEVAVERSESDYMVGNIYKGRVENVLPGMQAAFINIGLGKNAFLYAGDIFPHKSFQRLVEEDNLTVGAEIMIEIVKDAMGTKGPRATTHFSIPGRYVVVMPSVDYVGVSRRIESGEERSRLRGLAEKIRPKGMGVIVRTVAEGHTEEELARDFQYLSNLWAALTAKAKRAKAPFLLYRDADLVVRIIRDQVRDDIDEVIIDNADAHARMVELAKFISPDLVKKIHLHKAKTDIFTHYGVEDEWGKLADRRVDLKCGGYLIIDKTEALTVIDVNTGRFIGHSNLADTVFRTNMEAAAEISRQLRLRDIGGIIVADFIDMQKEGHKKAILAELELHLKADNTKTNVLGLTELGLVEMTRKKSRQTYEGTLYEGCPCCDGRGIVQSPETLVIAIRRQLRKLAVKRPGAELVIQMHPRIVERFGDKKTLAALEKELGIDLTVEALDSLQPEVYSIFEGEKALIRSNEPKKVRKPSARRGQDFVPEDGEEAEPLSAEEMEPLMAEKFAMDVSPEPVSTLEMRLAAMADSLWEPLYDSDDLADLAEAEVMSVTPAETAVNEDETDEIEDGKKPRRRRRSKKTAKPVVFETPIEKIHAEASAAAEIIVPDADDEENGVKEEPKKKKTRRRRKKKKTDETADTIGVGEDEFIVEDGPLPADPADGTEDFTGGEEPDIEAAPKKAKRRRRRKKKVPDGMDAAEAAPAEPESMQADEEVARVSDEELEAEAAPKKSKRRRRKKKKPLVEEITEVAPQEAAIEKSTEGAAEAQDQDEIELPAKKKRRRKRKKPAAAEASAEEEDEGTQAAVEVDEPWEESLRVPAHNGETEVQTVKKKRRRRRSPSKKKMSDTGESLASDSNEPD